MRPPRPRHRNRATGIASLLVLGVGLTALFLGFDWFWILFVVGFAVFVPIVSMLAGEDDPLDEVDEMLDGLGTSPDPAVPETGSDDPLITLRDRYARGELTDAQLERKLETLLETETLEATEERAARRLRDDASERRAETEAAGDDTN